jgi:L-amino acid N-acyltransferase YncA
MQHTQATVRPATADDLDAIAGIFAYYVTGTIVTFEEDPPAVSHWRQRLDACSERGLPFLVAEADGTVAGYAYASPWRPKPAYRHTAEDSVYLTPAFRGKGLGRLLLDALLAACANADVQQIIAVIADTGDPASVALHRACGFTDAGRLSKVGHKHGRWIDTLLLQRPVLRQPPVLPQSPVGSGLD